jgi:hypothetical protein
MLELRRVNAHVYDVFVGNQWVDHTRVKKGRSYTFVISGAPLPKAVLRWLHDVLAPNMPINYNQPLEQTLHNCAAIVSR